MPSEELTDVGRGITLCHESFGDPADPPLLLIMGLGTQMIAWHDDFCRELAGRGFNPIRFDNRDVGRSTRLEGSPPNLLQIVTRRVSERQYGLEDMADDTAGLIEALELGPVHVVGASMGGMIGQVLAARKPELVRSLVSIMSNTGSAWTGQPALGTYRYLLGAAPEKRDAFVEYAVKVFRGVGSRSLEIDEEHIRDIAARSYDRGHDPDGTGRQFGAALRTGNRAAMLERIEAPTLVIHGTEDRLVRPSGGKATAKAVPGAKLMMIEGMGHDLPRPAWPRIIDGIVRNAAHAGTAAGVRDNLAA